MHYRRYTLTLTTLHAMAVGYRDFINTSGVFAESCNKESNDLFALVNFQQPQIK